MTWYKEHGRNPRLLIADKNNQLRQYFPLLAAFDIELVYENCDDATLQTWFRDSDADLLLTTEHRDFPVPHVCIQSRADINQILANYGYNITESFQGLALVPINPTNTAQEGCLGGF